MTDILVIAVTGYGQDEDRERATAAGFDALLTRPADHRRILELMAAGIGRESHRGGAGGVQPRPGSCSHERVADGPRVSPEFSRRYNISRLIGKGGMGSVYLAWDVELSRQVAIKFLGEFQETPDSEAGQRFAEEARVCSLLKHPAIVRLFSSGWEGVTPYLVFEYIEGLNLANVLGGGSVPLERALRIADDLLRGLQKAHDLGIIHRDVKPSNVIIRSDDLPAVLVDFGLAKSIHGSSFRTGANVIMGTPAYMAPELVRGGAPHPGVDVYATGCLIYECLAGIRPFDGATDMEILKRHLDHPPRPLDDVVPGLPRGLSDVVMSALVKNPEDRVPSAGDLAMGLRSFRSDHGLDASMVVTVRKPRGGERDPTPAPRPRDGRAGSESKKQSPPSQRRPKQDDTIRVSSPESRQARSGGETRAVPRVARRLPWRQVLAILAAALMLLAWTMRDGVDAVNVVAGSDGSLTVTWESRRTCRGKIFLRERRDDAPAAGSASVEEGPPTRRHEIRMSGLKPATIHHLQLHGASGEPLHELTFTTPEAWTTQLEAGPTPSSTRIQIVGKDLPVGHLVLGEKQGHRRIDPVPGSLTFEVPHAPADLDAGMRIVVDQSPGIQWAFDVGSIPERADALTADLQGFDPAKIIKPLVDRRDFDPWLDFTKQLGEHPIGALSTGAEGPPVIKQVRGEYFRHIQQALERQPFWPRFEAFRPHAPGFFADPAVADPRKIALYTELHKLQYMDLLATCQHDMLNMGIRELYSSMISAEYNLKVDPDATTPGSRPLALLPPDTCWRSADYFDWPGLYTWFRNSRLASLLKVEVDLGSEKSIQDLFDSELRVELDPAATAERGGMATLRATVLLLGPSYFYEVELATSGKDSGLTLLLTQPGTLDWIESMDLTLVEKPSNSSTPGTVPGVDFWLEWGEIVLRFPARLLPPGPLRATTRYRHLPGPSIEKLSNIQRLAFLHRLTLELGTK